MPLRQYVSTYDITIGASAGCAPALFLALGLDAEQAIEESNKANFADFFDGAQNYPGPTKAVGQLYNVYYEGGMHPGKTCVEFFGDILERFTGDSNLTFFGLYKRFGTELCISVSIGLWAFLLFTFL